MSETMIIALISSVATLLVTLITLIANTYIERFKSRLEVMNKEYQLKRENLNEIYRTLISIINL